MRYSPSRRVCHWSRRTSGLPGRLRDWDWRAKLPDPEPAPATEETVRSSQSRVPGYNQQMMRKDDLLHAHLPDIFRLAAQYGVRNIRVFGSLARGEADAESDVDLLVELEPGRSLLDLGGLQMELQSLLQRPVDIVTERGLRERLRARVLKEAVPL